MSTGSECHVVKGLVAVRIDRGASDEYAGEIAEMAGTRIGPARVNELLRGPTPGGGGERNPDDLDEHFLNEYLNTRISLFEVPEGEEHPIAHQARKKGLDASPIHALGRLNHITRAAGTLPSGEFVPDSAPNLPAPSPGRVVAVVDSGVTDSMPGWLESGVEYDNPKDFEHLNRTGEKASHGVFVAGLIRRIAPEHTIHMARTAQRDPRIFTDHEKEGHDQGDSAAGHDPTTELDVAEAIDRLIARLLKLGCTEVAALNLSLGGSLCSEDDEVMVAISEAIDQWRTAFPGSEVFAAGGNAPEDGPIYPGALPRVRSVGAGQGGGSQRVWDQTQNEGDAGYRSWITDIAPGVNVTSPGGGDPDEWVNWNGSSFATAVATACYASRRPSEEWAGITHWPDLAITYDQIPGLTDFQP